MDSDKILDRIIGKAEHLADIALKAGVAYTGYKATGHWSGGITALVALRLAESPNLASGLAGTGMLAWLGLSAFVSPEGDVREPDPVMPVLTPSQILTTVSACEQVGGTVTELLGLGLGVNSGPNRACVCQLPLAPVYDPPEPPLRIVK